MSKKRGPVYSVKPKSVRNAAASGEAKTVRGMKIFDSSDDCPVWRFAFMDMDKDGPFSFGNISIDEWNFILGKMRQWESMKWGEIEGDRNHAIKTQSFSAKARKRLVEINYELSEELFSFHLDGRKRLFGIRARSVFYVFWYDPDHEVCPSLKKHT